MRWKGQWIVFEGPFSPLTANNSSLLSITCMEFYSDQLDQFKAQKHFSIDPASWQEFIKPESISCSFGWKGPSKEDYSKSFALAQEQIHSSNWKKAVPVAFDRSENTLTDDKIKSILFKLAQAPDTLMPYGFWKDGEGMIGATPEILFYRNKNHLETMALAGTEKKRGASSLLSDEKNLKEHGFVVQELFEKLGQLGKVQAKGPHVLELPTLYHLLTKFSVSLNEIWDNLKALKYLHPTSALGISPYKKWRELENLPEQKDRKYFGAPFLIQIGVEESLALVALRQIQWNKEEIRIGAGGGVVELSQEELEWQEILAKIDSVKKLMGIS